MTLMDKLRDSGWYLTDHGLDLATDYGNISDLQKIIKRATEFDLKEIGSGEGDITQVNLVLQIQKLRNVAAPKNNEESRGAPRMLKLSLTDGKNSYQAIEIESLSSISLNTPPGTKILFRGGSLLMAHGVILLKPFNIVQVLGGKVTNLVEKWELNKKLASHSRVRPIEEGGPPPWIPFGKKILKVTEQGKNFKALAEKEKSGEENAEFEAQRKNAIAEAAKQGSKKIFGGGTKQLLDHSVQRIVDQGYTIEQAEYSLKIHRNNVEKALRSLQKNDNKSNSNAREPREPREPKGKRGEKKLEEGTGKPSSGKISLFDFLEDKLPAQIEPVETNHVADHHRKDRSENYSDRHHSRGNEFSQSGRGGRGGRGNRGYQVPPRHQDENKPVKHTNNMPGNQQFGGNQYGGINSQKTKPPRFQRNQETQNLNQNFSKFNQEPIGSFNKFPQVSEFKSPPLPSARKPRQQPRQDAVAPSVDFRNLPDIYNTMKSPYEAEVIPKEFNNEYLRNNFSHVQNVGYYDPGHRMKQQQQPQQLQQHHQPQQANNFYASNNSFDLQGIGGLNTQQTSSYYNSNIRNDEPLGGSWVWRVGDRCMAKYWEDNMYYNAEVTAVSKTTCVVQFKDFHNYEEVLQVDCIPITEDPHQSQNFQQENIRKPDFRTGNRPPRFEQNQNHSNEYRRGGGSNQGGRNFKKRGQHRTSQPIYQPPAQRGGGHNTYMPQDS